MKILRRPNLVKFSLQEKPTVLLVLEGLGYKREGWLKRVRRGKRTPTGDVYTPDGETCISQSDMDTFFLDLDYLPDDHLELIRQALEKATINYQYHEEPDMAVQEQPDPKPNQLPAIWDLVQEDMRSRDKVGEQRYGTRLQPHNGRDALMDAYAEALDLVVYLRQALYERDGK